MNTLRRIVTRVGNGITRRFSRVERNDGFQLYRYQKSDGSFDYERYKQIQTAGNKRKLDHIWVREENIALVSDYIRKTIGQVKFGLCHGTRRGKEQEWFRKNLSCEVLGTDISETATQFPNTIQWDFHQAREEWIDSVDFIYSNSFDHTYDPVGCLNTWMRCVRRSGLCILEHSSGHERSTRLDPFGASIMLMPYLILTWSSGRYFVREIFEAVAKPVPPRYIRYLVIQRA